MCQRGTTAFRWIGQSEKCVYNAIAYSAKPKPNSISKYLRNRILLYPEKTPNPKLQTLLICLSPNWFPIVPTAYMPQQRPFDSATNSNPSPRNPPIPNSALVIFTTKQMTHTIMRFVRKKIHE